MLGQVWLKRGRPTGRPGWALRTSALAGLVAVVLLPSTPAAAFELFGFTVFGSNAEDEDPISPDAQRYTVDVMVAGADDDLTDTVRSASALWTGRDDRPPPSTAAFLNRTGAEYARIVGALYGAGYYGPTVEIRVAGRDPADIPFDAELPPTVPVAISVDPGPRFAFGSIAITGRAPPPIDPDDAVETTVEDLGLVPGAVARSGVVLQSERALIEAWREQGHPKAEIAARDAVANHPDRTLDVTVDVAAGPRAVYGPVTATGTTDMDPAFTAWMTGLTPGAEYDPDDLARAAANLRRLQVFSSQRLVEAETVGPDGTLPITVAVAERPLRVIGAGGTYSTVEGLGLEGYWTHRNLFGRAERLRLEGRVGGVNSVDPEDFSYFAGASFLKPGIWTPFTDLTADLSAEREVLEAYTQSTIRARVGLAHAFSEQLKGSVGLNVEAIRVEDAAVEDDFLLASLPASLTWDTRTDELEPTGGWRITGEAEPFHEFAFGNIGLIGEIEGSTYVAFDEDGRFVLAARAAVGSIVGAPRDELPASRLFFSGGGGSIRGYAYRNVGPRDADGDVVGGRSYVEASLELRARVTESIGIVPFLDAGNAFESSFPDFSEDLKLGAGVGLRYYTGLGAIRVDAAVPLNPEKGDPSFGIYIGLGQAF